jgi:hypothetical protein
MENAGTRPQKPVGYTSPGNRVAGKIPQRVKSFFLGLCMQHVVQWNRVTNTRKCQGIQPMFIPYPSRGYDWNAGFNITWFHAPKGGTSGSI